MRVENIEATHLTRPPRRNDVDDMRAQYVTLSDGVMNQNQRERERDISEHIKICYKKDKNHGARQPDVEAIKNKQNKKKQKQTNKQTKNKQRKQ